MGRAHTVLAHGTEYQVGANSVGSQIDGIERISEKITFQARPKDYKGASWENIPEETAASWQPRAGSEAGVGGAVEGPCGWKTDGR